MRASNAGSVVSALAALGAVALASVAGTNRERIRASENELLLGSIRAGGEDGIRARLVQHARQSTQALGGERAGVLAPSGGQVRFISVHGPGTRLPDNAPAIMLRGNLLRTLASSAGVPFMTSVDEMGPSALAACEAVGIRGNVAVLPLLDEQRALLGVVVVECSADALEAADGRGAELLCAIGRQVCSTLERRQLTLDIRRRSRHLACTPQLSRKLAGVHDPARAAAIVARELADAFGFARATVALADNGPLRMVASAGLAPLDETTVTPRAFGAVARTRRPYVACVGSDHGMVRGGSPADPLDDRNAPAGARSRIVIPVLDADGACVGAIAVYERDADALAEDDLHVLEAVADQLAGTLTQTRLVGSLERSYMRTIEALATALEAKDAYTLDHARSITDLAAEVGERMGMDDEAVRDLRLGALLHDIGKIGIPGDILNKPGPLDEAEVEVMKKHTVIGAQILAPIEFLDSVRPMVLYEHERWDGAGYPEGISGEQIPLGARIIFVCDAYHAMTSDRPYRKAMPESEARRRIRKAAGSQFDPRVVDVFLDVLVDQESGAVSVAE